MSELKAIVSMSGIRSRTEDHLNAVLSNRSEYRNINIDATTANDVDLLAEIGYKQELKRTYSTIQIFGIAFSIMGLLPSIASVTAQGLEAGCVGFTWGWFCASIFIFCIGLSMSVLSSALPTSGGLYYWTNYYAPEKFKIPLSFLIGCSNGLGLVAGLCSINYGFASEVLSAVYINKDGNFNITNGILYGVYAACGLSQILICTASSKHTAWLQSFSIYVNVFIIILFFIAVPIGARKNGFNDGSFIFGNLTNQRDWTTGWSFMLSWMPAIWTIGAFDSCVHMSEEAKNATKGVPIGILGSISVCGIVGWCIVILMCAVIKDGDVTRIVDTASGQPIAQMVWDALGKEWAVAFMALVAFAQYLMGASILTAASRQIWAFARDDGLPFHNFVKVVHPKLKVPIRATVFGGILSLICGLLMLIGPTGANALFSLYIASNYLSWVMPVVLVMLPEGRKKFKPGYFYLGRIGTNVVHSITIAFIFYVIVMSMFPNSKIVDKDTMNYTVVINCGVWILSMSYYYIYGYKVYHGPKSNLDSDIGESVEVIDEILQEKK